MISGKQTRASNLLEQIADFPKSREVTHCSARFECPPFDIYATCPHCGNRIKVRSFGGAAEIEDIFDTVFTWMQDPAAMSAAEKRMSQLRDDV